MKTYKVGIDITIYKVYEVEADGKEQAETIAKDEANDDFLDAQEIDVESVNEL